MAENAKINESQNAFKKERFEFVLTINGNIVCQRYFRIFNYNEKVPYSVEAIDAVDACVNIIDKDLKEKTHIFLENTAPRIFANNSEADNWLANASDKEKGETTYAIIVDAGENGENYVCYLTDDGFKTWTGRFNVADYVSVGEEPECVLEFAIYDNGTHFNKRTLIASKCWDGKVYPRFIRNNIDLSNSKNKYNGSVDGQYPWFESNVVETLNANRSDIIPTIVSTIYNWYSNPLSIEEVKENYNGEEYEYNTIVNYGEKTYNLDRKSVTRKYIRNVGSDVWEKTSSYVNNLYV